MVLSVMKDDQRTKREYKKSSPGSTISTVAAAVVLVKQTDTKILNLVSPCLWTRPATRLSLSPRPPPPSRPADP